MTVDHDERLARFREWIDDPSAITTVGEQVELLEAMLSCPHDLPAEYREKLALPVGATYHDAARKLLNDRFRTKGNFTLRSLIAVVTTVAVALGCVQLLPFTLQVLERTPLMGTVLIAGLALVVTALVVGTWRLAGKSLVRR